MSEDRTSRITGDVKKLRELAEQSRVFEVEATGEPVERFMLRFRGKGLARGTSMSSEMAISELHEVEIRLPFSYPESPPDVRWLTPIVHPNVSFSGFVNLGDLGLNWSPALSLDVVCERLWDAIRLAYVNEDRVVDFTARNWLEKQTTYTLPLDNRPLVGQTQVVSSNVVRYSRVAGQPTTLGGAASSEVMFIDENTPSPKLPERRAIRPANRPAASGDGDVLYIGPE
ncbi:ubiquitin-conjugating protein E2 [Pirellula staleyi DSM 6068]|uniref:Ubiquitin-conjugating protein E2 n=1 Tax=Pirellula staleyi (strain ATCC 27377 / DSM 6068 / ICPB 4128) TaxID=530564 RepID=D2R361_PIRSD|nr:ubiquitin-conjugating enzyme E2 [Pirellula staleyi]ADB18794.1 ubiquitin-conjugating protein E2 [Pirellula staleyi DSM 6068]